MKHPYLQYTTEDALELARQCRYGPTPREDDPMPTVNQAIKIIRADPRRKAGNWIDGRVALEILRLTRGEKVRGIARR